MDRGTDRWGPVAAGGRRAPDPLGAPSPEGSMTPLDWDNVADCALKRWRQPWSPSSRYGDYESWRAALDLAALQQRRK
jgi:hypothetical protein